MASEHFDPYHKWLGIRPEDQPPHHYRLLGIDLFEDDPDVIANAADQRMAHVRSFQTGRRSDLSQRLLNEIATAKICLLNPDKRAEYDATLVASMGSAGAPPPTAKAAPSSLDATASPRGSRHGAASRPRARQLMPWAISLIGVAVVLLVAVGALMWTRRTAPPAHPAEKVDTKPLAAQTAGNPSPPPPKSYARAPISDRPDPPADRRTRPAAESDGGLKPSILPGLPPWMPPSAAPADPVQPAPAPVASRPAVVEPVLVPVSADLRVPVPDAETQAKEMKLVRELFGAEYDAAATPEQKRTLAEKLLAKASENQDNPASKYVLLRLARDIAVQAADGPTAFEAVDKMAEAFRLDALEMKTEVLTSLSRKAQRDVEQRAIARQADELIDAAVGCDRFDLAVHLAELGAAAAVAAHDDDLANQLRARVAGIQERAGLYERAKRAIARLKQAPDDAQANLVAGRYDCLHKGDWDTGLPRLALGSDVALKAVASRDLQGADLPGQQVEVGDAWWDVAEKEDGAARNSLRTRAAVWYERALPRSTGLTKDKLQKRLQDVAGSEVAAGSRNAAPSGEPAPLPRWAGNAAFGEVLLSSGKRFQESQFDVPRTWLDTWFPSKAPVYLTRHANGEIEGVFRFRDGKLDGAAATLYEDGRLCTLAFYSESQLHGPLRLWEKGKKRLLYAEYTRGRENGLACLFHDGVPWLIQESDKGSVAGRYLVKHTGGGFQAVSTEKAAPQDGADLAAALKQLNELQQQITEGEKRSKQAFLAWFREEDKRLKQQRLTAMAPAKRAQSRERERSRQEGATSWMSSQWRSALRRSSL